MKKNRLGFSAPALRLAAFLAFAACAVETAGALELRVEGGTGNIAFDPGRDSPLGSERFSPRPHPLALIRLSGEINNMIQYRAAWERDQVLRNRVTGGVELDFSFIRIEAGAVLGPFNTGEKPLNPGASGGLTLEWPGILFGTIRGSSTLGSSLSVPGDYIQETGEIALGFWVPNVVCTFSLSSAAFSSRFNETLIVKDERTRWQFSADVHAKNVPYTIIVNMGYQSLERSCVPAAPGPVESDELRLVYLGIEGTWRVIPGVQILAGAEMPVYSWGKTPMPAPNLNTTLFTARAGVILTLPGIH
ncbi:MAG: hypothetical protein LBG42_05085 [Treponema sp.]|jgi:hypothetical protein|nr:hypothetical protein [Treponema sp.]